MLNYRKKFKFLFPIIALFGIFLVANFVFAQVDVGLEYGEATGLGGGDIRITIARIIRTSFGVLGIIAVIIVIAGGVMYMTAGGDTNKIATAKKILINGGIGLVIILSAFGIAQFILNRLLEATGARVGRVVEPGAGPGGGFGPMAFTLRGITPSGAIPIRNVTVRATFNAGVDGETVGGNFSVIRVSDGSIIEGEIVTARNTIEFTPSVDCPEPNDDRKCFDSDTEYRVRVGGGVRSAAGQPIVCGGFAPACEGIFVTGSLIDVEGPRVEITVPDEGESISVDSLVNIEAFAEDDAGISQIEFFVDDGFVDADAPLGETPLEFTGIVSWDTAGVVLGRHRITAQAYDIDANNMISGVTNIHVRAAHCFNGVRDADEGGLDCGGEDCAVCAGGACKEDGDCASGVCRERVCIAIPRIDEVSPGDGREGNYVTIAGEFFGGEEGQVIFLGEEGEGDNQVAPLAGCATAWQNNQVVVEVPVGAVDGPIQLIAANDEFDTTNNERGARIDDFDINEFLRPGICEIRPARGIPGDAVDFVGVQFGEAEGANLALVGGRSILPTGWGKELISGTVPNLAEGRQPANVIVGGNPSNTVYFSASSRDVGTLPSITFIDPARGPREEYVTVYGENFGRGMGTIIFRNAASGDEAMALVNFPAACGDGFWREESVTVKVPLEYAGDIDVLDGAHLVRVRRADGVESAAIEFNIIEGAAGPGICRINPDNGPAGRTTVTVSGERFGRDAGELRFWEGRAGAISSWADQQILSVVPPAAITGPVRTLVGEQDSNSINFRVSDCNESGCSEGEECCETGVCVPEGEECVGGPRAGGFAWRFSTGIIPFVPRVVEECREGASPSPSPWDKRRGGNSVCVNAAVNVRFTMEMDEETLNADNIGVYRCVAEDEENPCAEIAPVAGRIGTFEDGFQFFAAGGFLPSSEYYINLTTDIRGAGEYGDFMMENASKCGVGNSYCFNFGTRAEADPCAVGGVVVDPSNTTIIVQEGTKNYNASAISRGDICIALDSSVYDWDWSVLEVSGRATADANITSRDLFGGGVDGEDPDGRIDASQVATGRLETVPDPPVHVWAEIESEDVRDDGELIIDFTDPEIISRWPDCNVACVNSEIGAQFNTSMDPAALRMPGNFIVYECSNESCRRFEGEVDGRIEYSEEERIVIFEPEELRERTHYRVIIRGGVRGVKSVSGALLSRTNYGEGARDYSWIFRTRDSDVPCEIDNADLKPKVKVLNYIGAIQSYSVTALGAPDECDERGQRLRATSYNWSWVSTDPAVADFTRTRGDLLDVLPQEGVAGCSDKCLHTGTRSGISVCGNGRVEFGEDCEDGNIEDEDGCSPICLNEGSVFGRTICGNSRVERGEDCDDGNTNNDDGCSSICFNEGSLLGGSVCGNRDEGDGEDCDDGNTRDGDGCSGECLNEGSLTGPLPICGNGRPEGGEDCDDGNLAVGDGCNSVCLNEGTNRCLPPLEGAVNCCSNSRVERGEDCDDGNIRDGDGCGSRCLLEGSNLNYNSICGNARDARDLERGEECEFPNPPSGDRRIDPHQYARALFSGETIIRTATGEVADEGSLTVACVCERDSQCVGERFDGSLGCGSDRCCAPRPFIENMLPVGARVCRNALISVRFNELMDISSFSGNIRVEMSRGVGEDCPAGSTPSADRAWCNVIGNIFGVNEENKTILKFIPDAVLAKQKGYRVRILGDTNLEDGVKEGVRNIRGITMDSRDPRMPLGTTLMFRTGINVCTLDEIEVVPDPTYFFDVADKIITAGAYSLTDGVKQEIVPIRGVYNWEWNWNVFNPGLVTIAPGAEANSRIVSLAPVAPRKGETNIRATATITTDTISQVSTARVVRDGVEITPGRKIYDEGEIIILICQNPWPAREVDGGWMPYRENSTNFRFYYCRDAGKDKACDGDPDFRGRACNFNTDCGAGICAPYYDDDLPSIVVSVAAPPLRDILAEFIIPVNCPADSVTCGRGDGLGIRVMKNIDHFSPIKWYEMHGFAGNPSEVSIDGYPALQDGRTVYVNAVNQPSVGVDPRYLYTNIYIISFTQDAGADTMEIYGQILENISFTTTIHTWTDKEALHRDVVRLADIRNIEESLANYNRAAKFCSITQRISCSRDEDCPRDEVCSNLYPKLDSGSFLPHFTNSEWPSWQVALGNELGFAVPKDPLNRFNFTETENLRGCAEPYNNKTCYNVDTREFTYPRNSYVYSYENCLGNNYNLSLNLEYKNGIWVINKLFGGTYNLTVGSYEGEVWNSENICREERGEPGAVPVTPPDCGDGILQEGERCDEGSLNGEYNRCNASCSGWGAYCGDRSTQRPPYGVEVCDLGSIINGAYGALCSWDCRSLRGPHCGDREINGDEQCEVGQVETSTEGCEVTERGYRTQKTRTCAGPEEPNECRWSVWGECHSIESCGNGLVDGFEGTEECDDGNRSNEDGCTNECRNAFCGDGFTRRDYEQCDLGRELNGRACTPGRGLMCTYCSGRCTLLTISGD